MVTQPPLDRLMAHVSKDPDGCWRFAGSKVRGYGQFRYEGRLHLAHRVAYQLLVGPIPEGLQLDHLCRVRDCINPSHLEPVTHAENVRRGIAGEVTRARMLAKTHCAQGHEWNEENTGRQPGGRKCLACRRAYNRRWRAKQSAALDMDGVVRR